MPSDPVAEQLAAYNARDLECFLAYRVTGMHLEGWPEQIHGVVVYRLRDGQIAHVRMLM